MELENLDPATGAALVLARLPFVMLFPLMALVLLTKGPSPGGSYPDARYNPVLGIR